MPKKSSKLGKTNLNNSRDESQILEVIDEADGNGSDDDDHCLVAVEVTGDCKLTIHESDKELKYMQNQSKYLSSSKPQDPKHFQFDRVYDQQETQAEIFDQVSEMVKSVLNG